VELLTLNLGPGRWILDEDLHQELKSERAVPFGGGGGGGGGRRGLGW
jgi:hypothetical protein